MDAPERRLVSQGRYLLDLSMVPALHLFSTNLPKNSLLVPETLDNLLGSGKPTQQLALLLTLATMPVDPTDLERQRYTLTSAQLSTAMEAYRRLARLGVIQTIPDEEASDRAIRALLDALEEIVPSEPAVVLDDGSSVTPLKLVRRHVGTILSHAKRTRTAVLSRGRSLTSRLTGRIPIVQLADRLDNAVEAKEAFVERWFLHLPGAKATKTILGGGLAIAGFFSANPALATGGVILAVFDP